LRFRLLHVATQIGTLNNLAVAGYPIRSIEH
jgi:hypothetical protein